MNRAFIFLTTLAVLILLSGQTSAKPQKPSEDMILILIHHKNGPFLGTKGLAEDKAMREPSRTEMPEYEVYKVPYPQEIAYIVYLHVRSGRYWIFENGGIAPSSRFFGPGQVKDLRK